MLDAGTTGPGVWLPNTWPSASSTGTRRAPPRRAVLSDGSPSATRLLPQVEVRVHVPAERHQDPTDPAAHDYWPSDPLRQPPRRSRRQVRVLTGEPSHGS